MVESEAASLSKIRGRITHNYIFTYMDKPWIVDWSEKLLEISTDT